MELSWFDPIAIACGDTEYVLSSAGRPPRAQTGAELLSAGDAAWTLERLLGDAGAVRRLRAGLGAATSTERATWDALRRAIDSGAVTLQRRVVRRSAIVRAAAKTSSPPLGPADAAPTTWFEVKVVDVCGNAIGGTRVLLTQGSTKDAAQTNGSGVARWRDVTGPSFATARLADPVALRARLRDRWGLEKPAEGLAGERRSVLDDELSVPLIAETPTTLILFRPLVRVRLVGMHFDTNKSFLRETAMNGIRALVEVYEKVPNGKLLIVGHTDTAGSETYNLDLSLERAESVEAYLKNDVPAWEAWFASSKPSEKRWGDREVNAMIAALPSEPSVAGFQRWSNEERGTALAVDGIAGPKTRRALIEAYMALEGTTLPASTECVIHGLGEFFPRDDAGDDFGADATDAGEDRRVEIFCFDAAIEPPSPGPRGTRGEPEYPRWRDQVTEDLDFGISAVLVRVRDDDDAVLAGARVTLAGATTVSAISDDEGLAVLSGLAAGTYTVSVEHGGYAAARGALTVPLKSHVRVTSADPTVPSSGSSSSSALTETSSATESGDASAAPTAKGGGPTAGAGEAVVDALLAQTSVAVVVGIFGDATMPNPLPAARIVAELVDAKGAVLSVSQPPNTGPSGQVFARFDAVPFGDYTVRARLVSATSKAPEGRAEVPLTVSKAKIDATSKQVEANVTLQPVHRLRIVPVDPGTGAAVTLGGGTVTLTPAEVSILDADAHVFEIVPGTAYAVKVTPKKTLYFETEQSGIATGKGGTRTVVKMNKRTTVLYVIIDRPEDAGEGAHTPNRDGLAAAAAAFDPNLTVKFLKIEDIVGKTAKDLDDAEHPFAMFSGGSFSEWFQYGVDAKWKRALDAHMAILQTSEIPTLAVCGSHQLVAAAFHGFGAVAHMNDTPAGVSIQSELDAKPVAGKFPSPRVGEEGTYPIAVVPGAESDPVVAASAKGPVLTSVHHKDMVTDTGGFQLLFAGDGSRAAALESDAKHQVSLRCHVHGMKLASNTRVLYSVQFHPEMDRFTESKAGSTDGGFGRRFLVGFLDAAKKFWDPP